MGWTEDLTFDADGLIPVVAQEASSGEVLMLAYANLDALERTRESGRAHYWSRSRRALWRKGDTSGHEQEVVEVRVDCDGDAVLYRVRQTGPACHTLAPTCFHRRVGDGGLEDAGAGGHLLARLEEIVARRHEELPDGSYTTYLFRSGIDKILKKVGEETTELVVATKNADPEEMSAEAADLLFHLLVLLRAAGLPLERVWAELEGRFGRAPRRLPGAAASHPHS